MPPIPPIPPAPPMPCIAYIYYIAAYILAGFIIYCINYGSLSIALIYGFASAICFNIGLLFIICCITYGSDSIYWTIGLFIIYYI